MKSTWMVFATCVGLAGCSPGEEIYVRDAELLENPSPMGYPSSAPIENSVLRHLEKEHVLLLDCWVDKDFVVLEVETKDGIEGFVIPAGTVDYPDHCVDGSFW